ncbi:hypothetical protein GBAR_LOCUS31509 [Geodia barretti]|uniref:Uncharacterized protein n=1 Tax=Geodia barretti TaxID=519541 RepID=A0AA35XMG3_GEOBA|nr:hypothetical protein GBAR_LOCUS31509 [Geodia barretti]
MVSWGRVADLTQRTIVWSMVGLTVYAGVILTRRSYGMIQRHRKIKSLELSPADEGLPQEMSLAVPEASEQR